VAKTHCAVTHYPVQDCASRTFSVEDAAMLHFLFDPISRCFDPPLSSALPPLTYFERVCGFTVLYFILLKLIWLHPPRPWFVDLFEIALPFIPERNKENDDE
jgi:hypothetical protein